ncbi:hypothetical protein [Pseudonocardia acidicola]|uniref:ATP synthase E subunit n=1 Tax=Pseudonocardia acidicola TaxID=2724939 RepID=A0ABX1S894_9PSEU|nr:hypothetical protein [Pseudonocardia acidicola]NMH97778.1 hypothetical protein [Pseudonocardia acidicola]
MSGLRQRTAATAPSRLQDARTAADTALDPVRAALLREARADADRVVGAARCDAAAVLDAARARAAAVLAAATAAGKADGAARAARAQARARRERHAAVLAARTAAYAELRAQVRAAVRELPRWCPDLRDRLAARARAVLGPEAVLTATPDGGVLAELPGRRLELSLDALADLAVDGLGAEAELLWRP